MTEWKPEPYRSGDKRRRIAARGVETDIIIDYDDVNHDQADEDIAKIANILSDHWDDPIYEPLLSPEQAALNGINARLDRLQSYMATAGDRRDGYWCDRIEEEIEQLRGLRETYWRQIANESEASLSCSGCDLENREIAEDCPQHGKDR